MWHEKSVRLPDTDRQPFEAHFWYSTRLELRHMDVSLSDSTTSRRYNHSSEQFHRMRLCWLRHLQTVVFFTNKNCIPEWHVLSSWQKGHFSSVEPVCVWVDKGMCIWLSVCPSSCKRHPTRLLLQRKSLSSSTWAAWAAKELHQVQTGFLKQPPSSSPGTSPLLRQHFHSGPKQLQHRFNWLGTVEWSC